jgi:hypothetical protein
MSGSDSAHAQRCSELILTSRKSWREADAKTGIWRTAPLRGFIDCIHDKIHAENRPSQNPIDHSGRNAYIELHIAASLFSKHVAGGNTKPFLIGARPEQIQR